MNSIKVNCGNIEISNDNNICIIAGPCQLETEQHAMDMAGKIQEITKKLGLEENNADSYNTFNVPNVSFRFNSTSNNPYYMRGFKAIDMEISLIKNRQHHLLYDTQNKIKLLRKKNTKI